MAEPPPHEAFRALWDTLADVMGNAATATLLRRAAKRAAAHVPDLGQLVIVRDRFEYRYEVPAAWQDPASASVKSVCALLAELSPLLVELTGPVVLSRLAAVPELAGCWSTTMEVV